MRGSEERKEGRTIVNRKWSEQGKTGDREKSLGKIKETREV